LDGRHIALTQDKAFNPWVELYARDKDRFFEDFSKVFAKLVELGIQKDNKGVVRNTNNEKEGCHSAPQKSTAGSPANSTDDEIRPSEGKPLKEENKASERGFRVCLSIYIYIIYIIIIYNIYLYTYTYTYCIILSYGRATSLNHLKKTGHVRNKKKTSPTGAPLELTLKQLALYRNSNATVRPNLHLGSYLNTIVYFYKLPDRHRLDLEVDYRSPLP
jgi:hypothetical protein